MEVVLLRSRAELGAWPLDVRADLRAVDVLARLQLAASRLGCTVRLRDPDPDLRALLELVGLAAVLLEDVDRRPARHPEGQPAVRP